MIWYRDLESAPDSVACSDRDFDGQSILTCEFEGGAIGSGVEGPDAAVRMDGNELSAESHSYMRDGAVGVEPFPRVDADFLLAAIGRHLIGFVSGIKVEIRVAHAEGRFAGFLAEHDERGCIDRVDRKSGIGDRLKTSQGENARLAVLDNVGAVVAAESVVTSYLATYFSGKV